MRKTSVPAPFRGLMIAGVVVAVAAPFLGLILQALALLIIPIGLSPASTTFWWSDPLCPAGRRSAVPVGLLWAGYSTDLRKGDGQ